MTFSRLEDRRLVTGAGRYVSDWSFPGQLHAAFLRADRAHARIVSIDTDAARAMPGVRAVLTADDTAAAGFRSLPCAAPIPGKGGSDILKPVRPVLAGEVVRFVGECIVCVVADSVNEAQDAVEAIGIEYEDLPPVMSAQAAVLAGAPQLHPNIPGNVAITFETGEADGPSRSGQRRLLRACVHAGHDRHARADGCHHRGARCQPAHRGRGCRWRFRSAFQCLPRVLGRPAGGPHHRASRPLDSQSQRGVPV
jgi:hypothetical protein